MKTISIRLFIKIVNLKLETGAIVFGIANVITNFLLIGAIWLMARVERGYSTRLDSFLALSDNDLEAESVFSPVKVQEIESDDESPGVA